MGSLAPQGSGSGGGGSGQAGLTVTSSEDEAFGATVSFANALVVDLQTIVDSVFQIFNTSGTIALEYKIFASPKVSVGAPADGDDSWRNVLNGRTDDPTTYDHALFRSIPVNGQQTESLDNRFAWARIQIRTISSTATVKVWHRGTIP